MTIYKIDDVNGFYQKFIELQKGGASERQIKQWIEILVLQFKNRIEKNLVENIGKDVTGYFKKSLEMM